MNCPGGVLLSRFCDFGFDPLPFSSLIDSNQKREREREKQAKKAASIDEPNCTESNSPNKLDSNTNRKTT